MNIIGAALDCYNKIYSKEEKEQDSAWGLYYYRELACCKCDSPLERYIKHGLFPNPLETDFYYCTKCKKRNETNSQ